MARGRKKDHPRDQKAKGYPGRRKTKTEREIAKLEAKAAQDAKLLDAARGETDDLLALPMFIDDKRLAPAITIWREYAPRLDKLHLLATLDRYTFALFCIYSAEFVLANRDILDQGYSILVTTVAGSKSKAKDGTKMFRINPSVDRRDHAAKMMLDLAEKFGFTPLDRAKLIKENAMHFDEETLFGRARAAQTAANKPDPESEQRPGVVGVGRSLDSAPPGSRPN
jgi:P27 family predicted phage terminase small subunit